MKGREEGDGHAAMSAPLAPLRLRTTARPHAGRDWVRGSVLDPVLGVELQPCIVLQVITCPHIRD